MLISISGLFPGVDQRPTLSLELFNIKELAWERNTFNTFGYYFN